MERKLRANAQYPWTECVEIIGIHSSVYHSHLEGLVCKIFDKINCNVVKDNFEDCHRLKGDCVIVKLFKRKECKQVLSAKNNMKNISMVDLSFEGNGYLY